jgi:hypothetical protein
MSHPQFFVLFEASGELRTVVGAGNIPVREIEKSIFSPGVETQ